MIILGAIHRRDHLRAFARRVEVADSEVRIMGSKSELPRTLVAALEGNRWYSRAQTRGCFSETVRYATSRPDDREFASG